MSISMSGQPAGPWAAGKILLKLKICSDKKNSGKRVLKGHEKLVLSS
jgi:hypothetical protein